MEISIVHYQSRWMTDSGAAILIFESAGEILRRGHSKETFLALLSGSTIFSALDKMKLQIWG